jgi:glucose-1-phosphate cytidylyltransferase
MAIHQGGSNIKIVILAGGLGTRLSEESTTRPKPMVEIGGKPILWHIMKIYSAHGFNDFIICLGYKGYIIKEYFANHLLHMSDVTIDIRNGRIETHQNFSEPWKVTLVDTGEHTMTGGRIKKVERYVGNETFMLTYGDGLANINLGKLVDFHRNHKMAATVTAVQPPGRFGALGLKNDTEVTSFLEKPKCDGGYVNGGFFVLEPSVFDLISGDATVWEREPLERLAATGQLRAFKHDDFWYAMDTVRDKNLLEDLWSRGKAPWRVWK